LPMELLLFGLLQVFVFYGKRNRMLIEGHFYEEKQ